MDRRDTLSVREAREQLPAILHAFRDGDTHPVFLGSHRKTEAVVLPVAIYDQFTAERSAAIDNALGSLRAESLEPDQHALDVMERWRRDEIDAAEMRRQIRALYDQS